MEEVDYLIVGQGIAGSVLSLKLIASGFRVSVINYETPHTSSLKAAGIYNPITGRKMVKTWKANELWSELEPFYQEQEQFLGERFLFPKSIYRPFFCHEEQNDWQARRSDEGYRPFIQKVHMQSRNIEGLIDPYGGIEIAQSGFVDLPKFIESCRNYLKHLGFYHAELFSFDQLTINDLGITYNNISAQKVIFCDGPQGTENPFWDYLPYRLVKGEILDIKAPLPEETIYNRGVFMLPKNGVFRVGSTYDHQDLSHEPSEKGINSLKERLKVLYNGPYEEVSSSAGVRPATYDRKPFIGFHKNHPTIGVFNGFGTKGVSLVPYFASQLVSYLLHHGEIDDEVNIKRVSTNT